MITSNLTHWSCSCEKSKLFNHQWDGKSQPVMETKHWNRILGKWVLSGLLVILQKQCRRVYEIIKLKYTTPQTLKGYRLEVKKRLHQPFQVNFAYCLPHRLGLIIDLHLFNTPNWIEIQCQLVDFIFLFIQSFEHCPNSAQEFSLYHLFLS